MEIKRAKFENIRMGRTGSLVLKIGKYVTSTHSGGGRTRHSQKVPHYHLNILRKSRTL